MRARAAPATLGVARGPSAMDQREREATDVSSIGGVARRVGERRSGGAGGPSPKWVPRAWLLVAVLLAVGGVTATVVAAATQARHNAEKARQVFVADSAAIASRFETAVSRERDLVIAADAFVAGDPNASNSQFIRWTKAVRALQRYPELMGIGHVVIVPARRLSTFVAAARRDPAGGLPPGRAFTIVPAGRRAFYCLAVGSLTRSAAYSYPAGYDFCGFGPVSLVARDAGTSSYQPFKIGKMTLLSVMAPAFRAGIVPPTVAQRRSAFLGWVGVAVVPGVLLAEALAGQTQMAVTIAYRSGGSRVAFARGAVVHGGRSGTISLHNGWTVRTFAAIPATGLFAGGRPGALLAAGILLSVLLGTLVFLLGTGRARAERLASVKTVELLHQTLHDGLTGLPNRALITDRVAQLLARSRRNGTAGAVLFIDLDEFKNVNDTLGHAAGDQLLKAVAGRLANGLRAVDTVGRLGGDEFVVLIEGEPYIAPELVADRILGVMREPFELDGSAPIVVTATIGIAVGVHGTADGMLRGADMALYRAKTLGKDRYEVFRPEMEQTLRLRLTRELDLRSALAENQFRLVYQPIYNLEDLTLAGLEALLRWDHPTLGEVQPDGFIPLLEASGQIVEVGRWVLATACEQMAAWHRRGVTAGLAVNVSARQLDDDGIVSDVRNTLAATGLNPGKLMIEVTETALTRHAETTARRLREIKALGVNVAIDDFGTGYSSLASLQQFPIDTIKIDRAFTDALERSPESDVWIRILVQLGRDLGLRTLAEGVETLDQLDHLRQGQIDEVQGFLLSKPLTHDAVEALILPAPAPSSTG